MYQKILSVVLSFLLLLMGFIPPRLSHAQEIKKSNIAVLNLDARGISESEALFLSDYMRGQITRVVKSRKFVKTTNIIYTVVERSKMDEIFKEHAIQLTGCTDVSCAIELGKILNAEKVIIGSVGLIGETYSITARIVDVETAEIVAVADYIYKGPRDDLLTTGIPSVVNELMYGEKQRKSRKMLYIIAGVVVAAVAAIILIPDDNGKPDTGSISIRLPVPND